MDPSQGVQLETIQALADYWATDYDWRKFEERFKALPHFITEIDGVDIHFIHVRSDHEHALPLIVTHGWPGSTIEQLKIIEPLTNPTAHGAEAGDAFHLVIPSLPGHGFSGNPTETGWDPIRIARAWAELMKRLGYDRYVAQGGDWGNAVTEQLALLKPAGAARHPHEHAGDAFARDLEGRSVGRSGARGPLSGREEGLRHPGRTSSPPAPAMRGRWEPPADPLRHRGLAGRPGGLDARPRRGQLSADRARLRRQSRRPLARRRARQRHPLLADQERGLLGAALLGEQVGLLRRQGRRVPVGITVFPDELYPAPQSWAEKAYPKLVHYNRAKEGGHFAAWEQPETLSEEVRATFRSLR